MAPGLNELRSTQSWISWCSGHSVFATMSAGGLPGEIESDLISLTRVEPCMALKPKLQVNLLSWQFHEVCTSSSVWLLRGVSGRSFFIFNISFLLAAFALLA